jgi:hypothetical protein
MDEKMKYIITLLLIFTPIAYGQQPASPHPAVSAKLASELAAEKQYKSAAIEYRRLALSTEIDVEREGYYWAAAYIYHLNHDESLAIKMLDNSEDAGSAFEQENTLLRLDCAIAEKNSEEAEFYAQSLTQSKTEQFRHIAQSRITKLAVMDSDIKKAKEAIPETSGKELINAINTYEQGHDKSPRLGGFMGMIPGLGYAYSGEYANALRSLIMNGLFIYAMVETADDDDWGVFSVITFFEITWYTGSIYGGIDSAHRYNQRRLQACIQVIDDQSQYKPALHKIPAISLKYSF